MLFTIISIIVISIVGTMSHFLYDISNHNKFVGLFCAVNESTWEHIKIALTPTFLWSIVDALIYGGLNSYFLAKLVSLIVLIVLIPILFYGYKLIFKRDIFIFDILIFYIAIICSQFMFKYLVNIGDISFTIKYLSCVGLFLIFGIYLLLTLMPIKNFIFKDPISNKYGFNGHSHYKKK